MQTRITMVLTVYNNIISLQKNKKVHMVFVAYGPPDKVNYTNLEKIAAPDKVIRLPGTTKEFRKQKTLLELRKAVCGKLFYSTPDLIIFLSLFCTKDALRICRSLQYVVRFPKRA